MKKLLIFLTAVYSVDCYAVSVHWGNIITTSCETGGNIVVPTDEPTPPIGYHFVGWTNLQQIEYLESTGVQWIDSSFRPNQDTGIKTKFELLEFAPYGTIILFGAGESYTRNNFELYTYYRNLEINYNGTFWGPTLKENDIVEIDWNKNKVEISVNSNPSQIKTLTASNFTTPYDMRIFAIARPSNSPSTDRQRIYYFQIYDDNLLVRDFRPVLDINGVPCMYDNIEKKFYYNSGTGDFIAGSAVSRTQLYDKLYKPNDTIANTCNSNNDIYFYPIFKPNTLTLNWDYKDGRTMQTQCVYDTLINIPDDPVRQGYKFMGWRVKEVKN